MDGKDLLPIVDDPLGEQTPQTIIAPPAPTPASVSRTWHHRICILALLLHSLAWQLEITRSEVPVSDAGGSKG